MAGELARYFDRDLAQSLATQLPAAAFDRKGFLAGLPDLEPLALKDRLRAMSQAVDGALKGTFPKRLSTLTKAFSDPLPTADGIFNAGYPMYPLSQWFEDHVVEELPEHFNPAMDWLCELTQRFTAEFAVRPILLTMPKEGLTTLKRWTDHDNLHVRRLCSEGSRPKLPWGTALPFKIIDTGDILERLLDDPEDYVRRSVANHLGDLYKVDGKNTLAWVKPRLKNQPQRRATFRHALRHALKQGDPAGLSVLGYSPKARLNNHQVSLSKKRAKMGDEVRCELAFELGGNKKTPLIGHLEVHYPGKTRARKKVFVLKDQVLEPGRHRWSQAIKLIERSSRRMQAGPHQVIARINGREVGRAGFELLSL